MSRKRPQKYFIPNYLSIWLHIHINGTAYCDVEKVAFAVIVIDAAELRHLYQFQLSLTADLVMGNINVREAATKSPPFLKYTALETTAS